MLGIITWIIGKKGDGQKYVEKVSIDRISEQSRVEFLCKLFKNLQLKKSTPTGECKAWLHFQDGADLFCASPTGEPISKDNNFALLPEKISFSQDKLISKKDSNLEEKDKEKKDDPILPILHISTLNLLNKEAPFKGIPRYAEIMDSSIWNLYFNIEDYYNGIDIRSLIIEKIANNTQKGIYNLSIAQEYADLNARLAKQSFISDLMGHGKFVSPFVFHSEQDLATKRREEYETKLEGKVYDFKKYKWRVLLVDDKIGNNYLTPSNLKITKEEIIKDRIKHLFGEECKCDYVFLSEKEAPENNNDKYDFISAFNSISSSKDDKGHVVLLCVDSLDKAKAALKNYKFDFILLDYLLDSHKNEKDNEIERHYGYELLTELNKNIGKDCEDLTPYLHYDNDDKDDKDKKQYIVGPDHRYFFMFISAFTTAISERLRLLGYSRSEELWHIAEGACPTNTPELFCYNLQKMMVKRIKDSGMEKLNPDKILELTEKIFRKAEKGESSVRKRANENYSDVLGLLYHYNRILNDVEIPQNENLIFSIRGSVLMTSFMKDHENFGGLLEHLVHLVHLTAFGTARQWSEMWEEYLYFKNQFSDLFNKDNEALSRLSRLYGFIENHILELKKIN